MIVHGTTVATNALLEGKGVRAGLLITKGFRAVYEARGWSQPRGRPARHLLPQATAAGVAVSHRGGD
jgi:N-methylhydantoinase A